MTTSILPPPTFETFKFNSIGQPPKLLQRLSSAASGADFDVEMEDSSPSAPPAGATLPATPRAHRPKRIPVQVLTEPADANPEDFDSNPTRPRSYLEQITNAASSALVTQTPVFPSQLKISGTFPSQPPPLVSSGGAFVGSVRSANLRSTFPPAEVAPQQATVTGSSVTVQTSIPSSTHVPFNPPMGHIQSSLPPSHLAIADLPTFLSDLSFEHSTWSRISSLRDRLRDERQELVRRHEETVHASEREKQQAEKFVSVAEEALDIAENLGTWRCEQLDKELARRTHEEAEKVRMRDQSISQVAQPQADTSLTRDDRQQSFSQTPVINSHTAPPTTTLNTALSMAASHGETVNTQQAVQEVSSGSNSLRTQASLSRAQSVAEISALSPAAVAPSSDAPRSTTPQGSPPASLMLPMMPGAPKVPAAEQPGADVNMDAVERQQKDLDAPDQMAQKAAEEATRIKQVEEAAVRYGLEEGARIQQRQIEEAATRRKQEEEEASRREAEASQALYQARREKFQAEKAREEARRREEETRTRLEKAKSEMKLAGPSRSSPVHANTAVPVPPMSTETPVATVSQPDPSGVDAVRQEEALDKTAAVASIPDTTSAQPQKVNRGNVSGSSAVVPNMPIPPITAPLSQAFPSRGVPNPLAHLPSIPPATVVVKPAEKAKKTKPLQIKTERSPTPSIPSPLPALPSHVARNDNAEHNTSDASNRKLPSPARTPRVVNRDLLPSPALPPKPQLPPPPPRVPPKSGTKSQGTATAATRDSNNARNRGRPGHPMSAAGSKKPQPSSVATEVGAASESTPRAVIREGHPNAANRKNPRLPAETSRPDVVGQRSPVENLQRHAPREEPTVHQRVGPAYVPERNRSPAPSRGRQYDHYSPGQNPRQPPSPPVSRKRLRGDYVDDRPDRRRRYSDPDDRSTSPYRGRAPLTIVRHDYARTPSPVRPPSPPLRSPDWGRENVYTHVRINLAPSPVSTLRPPGDALSRQYVHSSAEQEYFEGSMDMDQSFGSSSNPISNANRSEQHNSSHLTQFNVTTTDQPALLSRMSNSQKSLRGRNPSGSSTGAGVSLDPGSPPRRPKSKRGGRGGATIAPRSVRGIPSIQPRTLVNRLGGSNTLDPSSHTIGIFQQNDKSKICYVEE
ncbi:hypothetical protein PHLCEN_2v6503 [Hermanssonia centrifuga]|uniref:Uncharacterized protein n=1 Tax=Hermanssonia centrifuga TaxID=98765 RepID=A0A2R6NZC1_9APHY|nr:hypothetical protein PHLCEN_2v6503 [Hermanssonia centrifuga]